MSSSEFTTLHDTLQQIRSDLASLVDEVRADRTEWRKALYGGEGNSVGIFEKVRALEARGSNGWRRLGLT